MSHVTDFQRRHSFVWVVERPLEDRPRYSQKFTIDGIVNYLTISVDSDSIYEMYVHEGVYDTLHCNTIVHVEDKKGHALPLSYKATNPRKEYLWKYSESEILKFIPDFLTRGILIFLVTFTSKEIYLTNYTFTLEPPKDDPQDKSVQTEEDSDEEEDNDSCHVEEKGVQTTLLSNSSLPCLESLSNDLSKLLNDESQPDVELTCGDQVVAAHRNVLSTRSKVFDAALSNFVEGRTGRIDVQDVDSGIFRQFVRYLYTGFLPDLTVETARRFYEAGDKYAVRGLMKRCVIFMKENLAPENACEMLALANEHYDQDLKEHVMTYMFRETIHLQDELWLDFCKGHPMLAIEVLNRFFKWQKATLNRF